MRPLNRATVDKELFRQANLLVAVYVLPLDWASSVLLLVTAPVIPVLMVLVGSYAEEHRQRQWVALSRMGATFLDALQGLPTLKMFGRSAEERGRVEAASEEFRGRTLKVLRYAFLSGLVLEFMTATAIALVAVTLGIRLVSGDMPFDEAFLVLLLAPEFYQPLRELGAHRHAGMEGMPGRAVERGTHDMLVEANGLYKRMLDVRRGMLMDAGV